MFYGCKSSLETRGTKLNTSTIPIREHTVQTVLWQQQSAEYKALCYQAFNLARRCIDGELDQFTVQSKPIAIITDIDETLIDNSPYNAKMIERDRDYSKADWIEWGKQQKAKAVPGAVEFLNYSESTGVKVFYISNRYEVQLPETMANMDSLGFPSVIPDRFLLRTGSSAKESRREQVLEDYNVVLYLGDNLSDFAEAFEKRPSSTRNKHVEKLKDSFGTQFIILPNPMYGDWETSGIYEGKYSWTSEQKDSIRRAKLISY